MYSMGIEVPYNKFSRHLYISLGSSLYIAPRVITLCLNCGFFHVPNGLLIINTYVIYMNLLWLCGHGFECILCVPISSMISLVHVIYDEFYVEVGTLTSRYSCCIVGKIDLMYCDN